MGLSEGEQTNQAQGARFEPIALQTSEADRIEGVVRMMRMEVWKEALESGAGDGVRGINLGPSKR